MHQINRWQKALLPFMQLIIVLLTVFYLVASISQFNSFAAKVKSSSRVDLKSFLGSYSLDSIRKVPMSASQMNMIAECYFEAYVTQSRQENAEALLLSRTWIKYLGFITGMILCIVGAVFILGKLQDNNQTSIGGEYNKGKLSLQSHSPGIIMAVLGTFLIVTTILTHQPIEKYDSSIYFGTKAINRNAIDDIVRVLSDSLGMRQADTSVKPPPGF